MSHQHEIENVKMEINGQPYYMKLKGTVPYLYDIDTNDEVGYWSSKKGQYIMFSLYNRLMKEKYESQDERRASCSSRSDETMESDSSSSSQTEEESDSSCSQTEEEEEEEEEESDSSCSQTEEEEEEEEEESDSSSSQTEEEEEEEEEEESLVNKTSNTINKHSIVILFLLFFVYLIFQKEFQSIYFDFIFLILINLLHTLKVFETLNDE